MNEPPSVPLACTACRTIDQADGVEDGRLYPVVAQRVKHELWIFRGIKSLQDRIADGITSFAAP